MFQQHCIKGRIFYSALVFRFKFKLFKTRENETTISSFLLATSQALGSQMWLVVTGQRDVGPWGCLSEGLQQDSSSFFEVGFTFLEKTSHIHWESCRIEGNFEAS
jgi:hypothetical protein